MTFFLRTELTSIRRLAIPTIGEQFLLSIVGVIDTLFVAQLGLDKVTAVGIATTLIQIYLAIFLALGTAVSIFVSRTIGETHYGKTKQIIVQAIYLTSIVGLIIGLFSALFAKPLLLSMGTQASVLNYALIYFRIVATSSLVISLYTMIGSILRAAGDTTSPLKAGLWVNAIHLVLDYLFIFGFGAFPGMGVKGAAIATVVSRVIGVGLLFYYLYQKPAIVPKAWQDWRWRSIFQKKLILLSFPAAAERLFKRFGQIIYFGMIVRMGPLVFAAHRLAGHFTMFTDVVGVGLSTAATTLIGQKLGSRKGAEANKITIVTTILTIISMTSVLFIIFLFIKQGASLFTDNADVIQQIAWVIGIDVLTQPATATVLILTAAFQASGDTKFPMVLTGLGIWIIRTGGVYLFGIKLGWGLPGVWFSILLDNYFRAAILFIRYRGLKAKTL